MAKNKLPVYMVYSQYKENKDIEAVNHATAIFFRAIELYGEGISISPVSDSKAFRVLRDGLELDILAV